MRPKSITIFEILSWIAVGLNTVGILILLVLAGAASRYTGTGLFLLLLLLPILLVAGLAVTTYMTARKASNAARFVYLGLAIVYVLLALFGMVSGPTNAVGLLLNLIQIALLIGAVVFMFQADANAWFAQGRQANPYGGAGGYPPAQPGNWGAPPPPPYGTPAQGGWPPAPPPPSYPAPQAPASSQDYSSLAKGEGAQGATRLCPYCAEEIKAQASKCRHCGSAVEPVA